MYMYTYIIYMCTIMQRTWLACPAPVVGEKKGFHTTVNCHSSRLRWQEGRRLCVCVYGLYVGWALGLHLISSRWANNMLMCTLLWHSWKTNIESWLGPAVSVLAEEPRAGSTEGSCLVMISDTARPRDTLSLWKICLSFFSHGQRIKCFGECDWERLCVCVVIYEMTC